MGYVGSYPKREPGGCDEVQICSLNSSGVRSFRRPRDPLCLKRSCEHVVRSVAPLKIRGKGSRPRCSAKCQTGGGGAARAGRRRDLAVVAARCGSSETRGEKDAARREAVRHEVWCKVPGAVRSGSERAARHGDGGATQSGETRRQGIAARQMVKRCGAAAKRGGASAAEQADERVHYCGLVLGCTWPGGSCARSGLFPDCVTVGRRTCSERTGDTAPRAVVKAKR
jgi:hypothetical protein